MSSDDGIRAVGTVGTPRAFVLCPHCQAAAIIRGSERVTLTIKNLRLKCSNEDCGFSWLAQISPVHAICPSQIENPEVHIPPCPPQYQRKHYRDAGRADPDDDPDQLPMFPDMAA